MSYLKFNHVFVGLMLLAFISAFALSPKISSRAQVNLGTLFVPVATPANRMGSWINSKFTNQSPRDDANPGKPRDNSSLLTENTALRNEVARLTSQLTRLEEINHERERLSNLRALCTPARVMGGDPGPREALLLAAGSGDGMKNGQAAICPDGLVGRLSAGVAGSRVQLITDTKSTLTVRFGKFVAGADGSVTFKKIVELPPTVAQGVGNGQLVSRMLPLRDVNAQAIAENDWAVLDDRDSWPDAIQGIRIGRVVSVKPRPDSPVFAEIRVEPAVDLNQLREVMVMTKVSD